MVQTAGSLSVREPARGRPAWPGGRLWGRGQHWGFLGRPPCWPGLGPQPGLRARAPGVDTLGRASAPPEPPCWRKGLQPFRAPDRLPRAKTGAGLTLGVSGPSSRLARGLASAQGLASPWEEGISVEPRPPSRCLRGRGWTSGEATEPGFRGSMRSDRPPHTLPAPSAPTPGPRPPLPQVSKTSLHRPWSWTAFLLSIAAASWASPHQSHPHPNPAKTGRS